MYCKDKKYVPREFQKHVKKPVVASARQPGEPSTVETLEVTMRGKKGDFL